MLGISQVQLRVVCRKNSMESKQIGGAWYIEKNSLRAFLKQLQQNKAFAVSRLQIERKQEKKIIEKKAKQSGNVFKVGMEIGRKRG